MEQPAKASQGSRRPEVAGEVRSWRRTSQVEGTEGGE